MNIEDAFGTPHAEINTGTSRATPCPAPRTFVGNTATSGSTAPVAPSQLATPRANPGPSSSGVTSPVVAPYQLSTTCNASCNPWALFIW